MTLENFVFHRRTQRRWFEYLRHEHLGRPDTEGAQE